MGKGKTSWERKFCSSFSKSYHLYFILENPPINKDIFYYYNSSGIFYLKYSETDKIEPPSLQQIFACWLNKLKPEEQAGTDGNRVF